MSILTIADIRCRCRINAETGCWHWLGAKCQGIPRIWTFDHERGDKRAMSGPKAVWNIAHQSAPRPGWLVFRSCVTHDCVNPVHLSQARSKADIGRHIELSGRRKGTAVPQRRANLLKANKAAGIVPTPEAVVIAIRAAPATMTGTALAERYGMAPQTVSRIRRGQSHRLVRSEVPMLDAA